jgi:hypothetical protein
MGLFIPFEILSDWVAGYTTMNEPFLAKVYLYAGVFGSYFRKDAIIGVLLNEWI